MAVQQKSASILLIVAFGGLHVSFASLKDYFLHFPVATYRHLAEIPSKSLKNLDKSSSKTWILFW